MQVTKTNGMIIYHVGNKVNMAKCLTTGRFIKHTIAMTALYNSFIEKLQTVLVLALCVIANVVGLAIIGLTCN